MAKKKLTPAEASELAAKLNVHPNDFEEVVSNEGVATGEKVVPDYDEQGNVIGWHKEVI